MDEIPHPELEQSPVTTWNWKDLFVIFGGIILFLAIGLGIMGIILGAQNTDPEQIFQPTIYQSLILAVLEAIALIGGVYLFGLRRKGLTWSRIGLIHSPTRWLVISVVLTAIAIPITGIITVIVSLLLGTSLENPQLEFLLPDDITGFQALLMILLAGIIVPFSEEIVFRGVIYRFLREKWGVFPGVLISSIIFGLIHLDLAVGLTAFILGILLAILFEYSRSLWPSVLLHALNNTARLALLYILFISGFISGI